MLRLELLLHIAPVATTTVLLGVLALGITFLFERCLEFNQIRMMIITCLQSIRQINGKIARLPFVSIIEDFISLFVLYGILVM